MNGINSLPETHTKAHEERTVDETVCETVGQEVPETETLEDQEYFEEYNGLKTRRDT